MAAVLGARAVDSRGKGAGNTKALSPAAAKCEQDFARQNFSATGVDAMHAQTDIIKYHIKMSTIKALSGYGLSGFLALLSAVIVVFAPEFRSISANLFAGAFLVSAIGAAGFARFSTKSPGLEMSAS